jgi:hypothetical protein
MTAAALSLKFWPYILAAVAAVVGGWKLRQSGVNSEQAKQAAGKLAAAERKAAGMTDDQARAEAMKWAKR